MKIRILAAFIVLSCIACGSAAGHSKTSAKSAHGVTIREKSSSVDKAGYRHIVVEVTVHGPLTVNIARCGGPAPVNMWVVDRSGKILPDDIMYAQFCQEAISEVIPTGKTKTYIGNAGYPAKSGPVTLHGTLALSDNKTIKLPLLQIH